MRIALLQGGGNCPSSSDAHRGLAETAIKSGHEVLVIPFGFRGLVTPDQQYRNLFECDVVQKRGLDGMHLHPGVLKEMGSSRTKPIPVDEDGNILQGEDDWSETERQEEYQKNLAIYTKNRATIQENLTRNRIDILGIVGGDDTLGRGASMLYRHGILMREGEHGHQTVQAVGVPKTIDNDFRNIAYSFGATSASLRGQSFVQDGRTEANYYNKVMILEAMGRDCGWLAAASAEHADGVLIPEVPLAEDAVVHAVQRKIRDHGKNLVLVTAEGFPVKGKKVHLAGPPDGFGHHRLGGVRFMIEAWLNKAKIETMQLCPGYLYRSGAPTERDAQFGYRLGVMAMEAALGKGQEGRKRNGVIAHLPEGSRSLEDPITLMDMAEIRGGKQLNSAGYDPETLQFVQPLMPEPESGIAQ